MMHEQTDEAVTMRYDDGSLRAYLDGDPALDAATRDGIAAALASGGPLAARYADLRAASARVSAAFVPLAAPEPDAAQVTRAYRLVQTRIAAGQHTGFWDHIKERMTTMTHAQRAARTRRYAFAGALGAVALVLVLIFAPVGNVVSAALDKFRYQPTKFAVITVKQSDFAQFQNANPSTKPAGAQPGTPTPQDRQKAMQELEKYITITSSIGQGQMPGREVKSAAEVQAVTGRPVSVPSFLPAGVPTTPRYYVSDKQTANATLNLKELRPVLQQSGMGGLLPATGDSATIALDAPAASIVSYGIDPMTQAQGAPTGTSAQAPKGVVVAAIGTPTIDFQGLDVPGIVNTIASMPGFPPELAAQLKSADLQRTLIIPVTDEQTVKNGTTNGAPSTLISQKDGSGSVLIYIKNNVMTIIYGSYDGATVEKIAQSVK